MTERIKEAKADAALIRSALNKEGIKRPQYDVS